MTGLLHSSGDAMIGVVRDRHHPDRMMALMTFHDHSGCGWQIRLSPTELRNVLGDALKLLIADQAEVSNWWTALGLPGTTTPADGESCSTASTAGGNGHP